MPGVTMKDVAAAVGVSVASVSNAYNRPEKLSEDVRARILTHRRRRSGTTARARPAGPCGTAAPTPSASSTPNSSPTPSATPTPSRCSAPWPTCSRRTCKSINLLPIPNDSPADPAGVAYAVVDGFLAICAGDTHPGVIAARRRGIPVVLTVASDAGRRLRDHRRARGRPRRSAPTSPSSAIATWSWSWTSRTSTRPASGWARPAWTTWCTATAQIGWVDSAERLRGLSEGLGDAQVSFVSAGTNSVACAVASTQLVLRERPSATAVVAVSDLMALAVVGELTKAGLDVPRDVSVAGFDGIDAALAAELTTIGQPIARRAVAPPSCCSTPPHPERQVFLPSELVVGRTTGPAPRR